MSTNYTNLCIDVANWLNNDSLEGVIPTFISHGQEALEDEMRIPAMEYQAETPYIPKGRNYIDIPSDYIEAIYLCLTDQIPSPVNAAFTAGAGTLAAGTYYYRVSAVNVYGETLASTETSLVLAVQGGVNVNWTKVDGATGYKVYGRSTGAELLIATVGDVSTYLDNGSVTPNGALPSFNSTGKTRYDPLGRDNNRKFVRQNSNIGITGTGRPLAFTRVGDRFVFEKYTDKNYVYELNYYRRLSKLSESNQTNWWTLQAEKALLYSALLAAVPFLGDDPRAKVWEKAREKALEGVKLNAVREMKSGTPEPIGSINIR